jgi:hypothetical protein
LLIEIALKKGRMPHLYFYYFLLFSFNNFLKKRNNKKEEDGKHYKLQHSLQKLHQKRVSRLRCREQIKLKREGSSRALKSIKRK